jgi:putative MATE family efflux protein
LFLLLPILFVFVIYSSFLRGTGETRIPLVVLLLNTCMVAGLTPALILGWGGIPPQGIRAAVFGSATANLLSLCGMIAYLNWHNHPLAFNREMIANVRFRWKLIREIVNIGLPTGLQMVMLSLSQIVLIVFVNRFGSDATAAFGAALQISGFAQLPSVAVALTASIFAAQMIGAGDPSRVGTITRVAVILNYVAGGIVMFFVYIFAPHLLGLFLKTPVALKIGLELTYISMWSYLVYGHAEILTGVMRSYRVVWTPMLIEVAALWLFEVPFAWYFSQQFGLTGIWWAYPTSNVAVLAAEIAFVTLYWRRKRRA